MADNPAVATPIYDEVLRELAGEPEPGDAEPAVDDQSGTTVPNQGSS